MLAPAELASPFMDAKCAKGSARLDEAEAAAACSSSLRSDVEDMTVPAAAERRNVPEQVEATLRHTLTGAQEEAHKERAKRGFNARKRDQKARAQPAEAVPKPRVATTGEGEPEAGAATAGVEPQQKVEAEAGKLCKALSRKSRQEGDGAAGKERGPPAGLTEKVLAEAESEAAEARLAFAKQEKRALDAELGQTKPEREYRHSKLADADGQIAELEANPATVAKKKQLSDAKLGALEGGNEAFQSTNAEVASTRDENADLAAKLPERSAKVAELDGQLAQATMHLAHRDGDLALLGDRNAEPSAKLLAGAEDKGAELAAKTPLIKRKDSDVEVARRNKELMVPHKEHEDLALKAADATKRAAEPDAAAKSAKRIADLDAEPAAAVKTVSDLEANLGASKDQTHALESELAASKKCAVETEAQLALVQKGHADVSAELAALKKVAGEVAAQLAGALAELNSFAKTVMEKDSEKTSAHGKAAKLENDLRGPSLLRFPQLRNAASDERLMEVPRALNVSQKRVSKLKYAHAEEERKGAGAKRELEREQKALEEAEPKRQFEEERKRVPASGKNAGQAERAADEAKREAEATNAKVTASQEELGEARKEVEGLRRKRDGVKKGLEDKEGAVAGAQKRMSVPGSAVAGLSGERDAMDLEVQALKQTRSKTEKEMGPALSKIPALEARADAAAKEEAALGEMLKQNEGDELVFEAEKTARDVETARKRRALAAKEGEHPAEELLGVESELDEAVPKAGKLCKALSRKSRQEGDGAAGKERGAVSQERQQVLGAADLPHEQARGVEKRAPSLGATADAVSNEAANRHAAPPRGPQILASLFGEDTVALLPGSAATAEDVLNKIGPLIGVPADLLALARAGRKLAPQTPFGAEGNGDVFVEVSFREGLRGGAPSANPGLVRCTSDEIVEEIVEETSSKEPMSSGSESAPESDSANSSNFGEIPSDEEVDRETPQMLPPTGWRNVPKVPVFIICTDCDLDRHFDEGRVEYYLFKPEDELFTNLPEHHFVEKLYLDERFRSSGGMLHLHAAGFREAYNGGCMNRLIRWSLQGHIRGVPVLWLGPTHSAYLDFTRSYECSITTATTMKVVLSGLVDHLTGLPLQRVSRRKSPCVNVRISTSSYSLGTLLVLCLLGAAYSERDALLSAALGRGQHVFVAAVANATKLLSTLKKFRAWVQFFYDVKVTSCCRDFDEALVGVISVEGLEAYPLGQATFSGWLASQPFVRTSGAFRAYDTGACGLGHGYVNDLLFDEVLEPLMHLRQPPQHLARVVSVGYLSQLRLFGEASLARLRGLIRSPFLWRNLVGLSGIAIIGAIMDKLDN